MTQPAVPLSTLVDIDTVKALLIGRPSDVLDPQPRQLLYFRTVEGVSSEVAAVCGKYPPDEFRDMAVWCVSLGVAASLESALYPEQQVGDEARARELRNRFLGVLAALRSAMTANTPGAGIDLAGSYSTAGMPRRTLDTPYFPECW